ncbi:MAG: TerC family protein [Brevundimonas sp.]|jgi:predicted tellurium resistance membrane protein TerC|uniref:TerC family protein n=1 Tax=Brevundimonas sp. TaxID=1871086 RepID=UPI002AB8D6C5|nr:TerC family protein [Brevundimonas sp.]MDZ4109659.1 TerC family protein [Brevundimonas sp.]
MFDSITPLLSDPAAWAALVTLIVMEVVLGIDNLIFISILSNKLPPEHRSRVRRIGISLALVMRLALLSTIAWIVTLTAPVFAVMGNEFSWKDMILIVGGLFLVWKATKEIHHTVDPNPSHDLLDKDKGKTDVVISNAGAAIFQIILIDLVFSVDSILTAVGMTEHLPIMVVAVLVAITVMLLAADPLGDFIDKNPTIVMLALGFLLMIGMVLIAEGFGAHVPKGYIYAAMAFSAGVEVLNMMSRKASTKRESAQQLRAQANQAEARARAAEAEADAADSRA